MFDRIFKAIGRMFTVPRAQRAKFDANPEVQAVKPLLVGGLASAIAGAVDQHVSDPTANELIKAELGHLLQSSGLAK